MLKTLSVLLLSLFTFIMTNAQDNTSKKRNKKVKILPVPSFGYSPETRTYVGAVALFTFHLYNDSTTRASNAKVKFTYTWNNQAILENDWNYFFNEEKWFTKGRLNYSKYPDQYFGIGPETPDSNKLNFSSNRLLFEVYWLKKIYKQLFTGLNIKYVNYTKVASSESGGMVYPELINRTCAGIGYTLLKDSRNNLLTPSTGAYCSLNGTYNFSRENYFELSLDLRGYHTWRDRFTLATRFYNGIVIGTPPFYDYSLLGGDRFVRGYLYGRFRDNNLSTLQAEFRYRAFWRIGFSTFGGISNVYSPTNPFRVSKIKLNYGGGIRFVMDKKDKTNLRLDYAVGEKGNTGFYIAFGESF